MSEGAKEFIRAVILTALITSTFIAVLGQLERYEDRGERVNQIKEEQREERITDWISEGKDIDELCREGEVMAEDYTCVNEDYMIFDED